MVSTNKVCKFAQRMFFTLISRNHSKMLFWLTAENKTLSTVKFCSKFCQNFGRFTKVFVHYSTSVLMICKLTWTRIDQNDWIALVVRWSVSNFFAPNSPMFRKGSTEEREIGNSKVLCFTSKHNKFSPLDILITWNTRFFFISNSIFDVNVRVAL